MGIAVSIVHAVADRLRLRVPALSHDPGLAPAFQQWLLARPGISGVRINQLCDSVVVGHAPAAGDFASLLLAELATLDRDGLMRRQPTQRDGLGSEGAKWELRGGAALVACSAGAMLALIPYPLARWLTLIINLCDMVPVVRRALTVLGSEQRLNVDTLDALAIALASGRGQLFTASFMIWLITLGDWIRDRTADHSRRVISGVLDYQQRQAWVVRAGEKVAVAVRDIAVGETVVVYSGTMVPVDGEVIGGQALLDQRAITGEAMPVTRQPGDKVYATSLVREGKLYLRALKTATQSLAAQIVQMIETAPVGETRIQNYAERFADRLVAPTLLMAGGLYAFSADLNRTLSVLIVDFGTGIRVAAPTAVLAAIVGAARRGVLIRGGRFMEVLDQVDAVVFDKTGTLTVGWPVLQKIVCYDEAFPRRRVLQAAAAAEVRLSHPLAQATVARAASEGIGLPPRRRSRYTVGMGVEAEVEDWRVVLGSERFLSQRRICTARAAADLRAAGAQGLSTLLLAVDGELVALLLYSDEIRPEAARVIGALRQRGMRELVMLTGDNQAAAQAVANQLGITQFRAEVLPQEKVAVVNELRGRGRTVAMVGDGINDAAALALADVGIAMKNGADITHQTANVVLMHDDLSKLLLALDLSHQAINLVHQNYAIVVALNALAMALSVVGGVIPPEVTALLSNGSAVAASINGLRPVLRL